MTFGSSSAMFRAWPNQAMGVPGTTYGGLSADTVKVALFNDTTTPDKDAAVASTGFNTGVWTTANEVTSVNWATTGLALAGKTFNVGTSGTFIFDATDLAGGGTVTLTNAFGCLVYDDTISGGTVADQGVTFHSFGGAQTVTAGTFTIVWHANGLFRITM